MSKLVTLSSSLALLISSQLISAQEQSAAEIDWRSKAQLSEIEAQSLPYFCAGKYIEPPLRDGQVPLSPTQIDAEADDLRYEKDQKITLTGDVVMNQGGQEVRSPKVVQDELTQISEIDGPLQLRQKGMLLTGEHATSNMAEGTGTVHQATFLIHGASLRGTAAKLQQEANGHILMDDAVLTRCDPGSNVWSLKSKDIELAPEQGFGTARDMTIRIKDIPVLYTPYMRFPINDKRLSGFLLPNISYDSDGGTDINIPYYFNFHPQYDATYQLRSQWKRGIIHDTQVRYKSKRSINEINAAFLSKDDIYDSRNIEDRTSSGTDTSSEFIPPFEKNNRWLLNLRHDGGWDSRWKTHLTYSAVSDTDYLHDIGGDVGSSSVEDFINPVDSSLTNRRSAALDRLANVKYRGETWNAELGVQGFQSLDANSGAQYEKLPELKLDTKQNLGPVDIKAKFNYSFFEKRNSPEVIGERAYIDLEAGWPMRNAWGFFEPKLGVIHRKYQLDDTAAGARANPELTTPRFSIDTGLYFDRYFKLGKSNLQQTLEPRLFYLYVEEDAQDDLPSFDAAASTLSYGALFRHNRFSGFDRIGDARQVSLGLTTRFLSEDTGAEFFSASLGQIYYLKDRTVNFQPKAADNPSARESALFAEARVKLNNGVAISGAFEWEPDANRSNRGSFAIKYRSEDRRKIFNLNYIYTSEEIQTASLQTKAEESNINIIWPLRGNWSFIGLWNFGWDDNRTIESFYGLEYNDCCWKTRLVVRRFLKEPRFVTAIVDDPGSTTGFKLVEDFKAPADTGIFFEFQLKGLATLGRRLDSLLEDGIPGYRSREDKIGL